MASDSQVLSLLPSETRASDARWGEAHAALPREGGRERPPLKGNY